MTETEANSGYNCGVVAVPVVTIQATARLIVAELKVGLDRRSCGPFDDGSSGGTATVSLSATAADPLAATATATVPLAATATATVPLGATATVPLAATATATVPMAATATVPLVATATVTLAATATVTLAATATLTAASTARATAAATLATILRPYCCGYYVIATVAPTAAPQRSRSYGDSYCGNNSATLPAAMTALMWR